MKIYINKDGQVLGPFTPDELKEQVYRGELARTVPARLEGAADWQTLESLWDSTPSGTDIPPVVADVAVPLDRLRDPKEKTALIWLYVASVPVWAFILVLVVVGWGIPLVFVGIVWLLVAFGEIWFTAYLKTNAVRVSEKQLPELHRALQASCWKLGMACPDVYVIQHNVWNAFATKIFGRRMIVLFSGAVDSILLKGDTRQVTWLVGHELGHHWAGHLDWSRKIAKLGGWLIWAEFWYSRRRELTCDRVGLFCAGSLKTSQLALMNATVGAQLASQVNMEEAATQWYQHRDEFFVKYRTLYSTYPHLLARLEHLNLAAQEFGMSR